MKRMVSLILTAIFLLSLTSGALAADQTADRRFTDWDDISRQAEVAMLADLELVSGYSDGTFRPYNCITRAEISKVIAGLLTDQVPAAESDHFSDTAGNWARDYIEYCAGEGILAGSDGAFRPGDYVTVRELAKMLLTALGHDAASYTGAGWVDAVDRDADELEIYAGYSGERTRYVTREDVCLLIANALQCPVIRSYDAAGQPMFVLDSLMSPMSLLEYRFDVIPVTGVVQANAVGDLRDGSPLSGNLIHIEGYTRDFLVSAEVAENADLLGRTVTVYARFFTTENQVYGLPSLREGESVVTFQNVEELHAILLYSTLQVNNKTAYYKDLMPDSVSCLYAAAPGDSVTIIDHEADGIIDIVFVTTAKTAEPEKPAA